MFWFFHYAAKVLMGVALVGVGITLYANRHWLNPSEEWVQQLGRVQTETVPIVGVVTGRVTRVTSGERLRVAAGPETRQYFQIVGISTPVASLNPHSPDSIAFRESRDFLATMVLSNEVRIACTLLVPDGGGMGGVYLGETNVAVPMLSAGKAIVHDASLRSLPVSDQIRLLVAEKTAKDARLGVWANAEIVNELLQKR